MKLTPQQIQPFVAFVEERHRVYLRRVAGQPKPWTQNQILQRYRFCNVYRELDTVTRWIRKHWRHLYGGEPDFWFTMVVARLLNRPETLCRIDPLPWRPAKFVDTLQGLMNKGEQVFSPAYIVSTNGMSMQKVPYLAEHVLSPLWAKRQSMRPRVMETLASYHARLCEEQGLGSFMAAQVVADVKNEARSDLWHADDWWSWAAPGPGSLRGLNRVRGNGGVKIGYKPGEWLAGLHALQEAVNMRLAPEEGFRMFCAQDIQNCLCEYDKYERVRLGEGRPKQQYPGTNGDLF